ncbi:Dihydrodipicolinate synthase [Coemansia nantahalensis]|uniref:Dihydrodipicolinate synthase n=1 Tax=Coemansia nantahalensis TaxID=2789366 RepID=A0ACC1JV12_9FUNG|nr:Dihydrodipicolinate synthase [Coemansia nantahalensis]
MNERAKIAVGVAAAYLAYRAARYLWAKDTANSAAKARVPCGEWTKRQLAQYTGADGAPILIALDGKVYDVSAGRGFYGPGGAYSVFAGRDAVCPRPASAGSRSGV